MTPAVPATVAPSDGVAQPNPCLDATGIVPDEVAIIGKVDLLFRVGGC